MSRRELLHVSGLPHAHCIHRSITSDAIFDHLGTSRSIHDLHTNSGQGKEDDSEGKLDILVRTSNVKRLSDFMMWQVRIDSAQRVLMEPIRAIPDTLLQASEDTQLHFVNAKWPEFSLTDLLPIILGWQQKVWSRSLRSWTTMDI